jgi:hypothetical protein
MAGYSKGVWVARYESRVHHHITANGKPIAFMALPVPNNDFAWTEESKANVVLMAAAPVMLQALRIAEEQYENFAGSGKDDGTLAVIRSAIKEATVIKPISA